MTGQVSMSALFAADDAEVEKAIASGTTEDIIILKRVIKEFIVNLEMFDKQCGEELMGRMFAEGQTEWPTDEYVARLCTGRTPSTLSELRLVEQGVDAQVIANSRVEGREYVYVEIRKKKEK